MHLSKPILYGQFATIFVFTFHKKFSSYLANVECYINERNNWYLWMLKQTMISCITNIKHQYLAKLSALLLFILSLIFNINNASILTCMFWRRILSFFGMLSSLNNKTKIPKKTSWHRLVSAQFPIIYLYALFLTHWRENLKYN